jgi:hypothetical protein
LLLVDVPTALGSLRTRKYIPRLLCHCGGDFWLRLPPAAAFPAPWFFQGRLHVFVFFVCDLRFVARQPSVALRHKAPCRSIVLFISFDSARDRDGTGVQLLEWGPKLQDCRYAWVHPLQGPHVLGKWLSKQQVIA